MPTRRTETNDCPRGWCAARDAFLAAVHPGQRPAVATLLHPAQPAGAGLRLWLRTLAARGAPLPDALPVPLVRVYLDDAAPD